MAKDKDVESREVVEDEGPRQKVERMPTEDTTGPYFPSGMSAPEAALAGATADMSDEDVAKLKGETPEAQQEAVEGS
jgi:hypothetical protein